MKIIRVNDTPSGTDVVFHPDSTLLLTERPMFYPDFGGSWHAVIYLAVHINRLGKGVSIKFAPRYYDGVTLALHSIPAEKDILPHGILTGMDNSITHGLWLAPEMLPRLTSVCINGIETNLGLPDMDYINRMVSWVSTHTTIRTGDLLLIPSVAEPLTLRPRSWIEITADDGQKILSLKIV